LSDAVSRSLGVAKEIRPETGNEIDYVRKNLLLVSIGAMLKAA
jgi:hypothetical protein